MRRFACAVALMLAMAGLIPAQDSSEFFFKPGDRIVFLGDSITEQFQYSSTIELYLTTRFPKWNLTFLNAGIGGDTAGGGAGRFQKHVLDEKPTAVTINFGMNDGGYGAFNEKSGQNFAKNTETMLEAAKKAGVRVAVISPNAVDRRVNEKFKLYLETQKQFYAPLKELASKHSFAFADQYAITRAALEKMEADGADKVRPFGDGFHTSSSGGLLMAHAILTSLKAPALVSDAEIDAKAKQATGKQCKLDKLAVTDTGLSFERSDDAIPLPIQKDWVSLLPYMSNLKDLNWYGLRVAGLPAGKYTLEIDGKEVGAFTHQELAQGGNLGNLTVGPVYEQGQKVWQLIGEKNKIVHGRFRGVVMAQVPDWLADVAAERKPMELVKRLALIGQKQEEIYKAAQPVPRKFELKKN